MLTQWILQLLVAITVAHAQLQSVNIYAKSVASTKTISLGSVQFDGDSRTASFVDANASVAEGDYCIGTEDIPHLECFTYTRLRTSPLQNKQLHVQLDAENNISHLSMASTRSTHALPDASLKVVVSSRIPGPSPIRDPRPPQTKNKQAPKSPTDKDDSPQSWVQRNWMYLVPPLLIAFVFLTEEPKK